MCREAKNERKDTSGEAGPGCCPGNHQEKFGKMGGCCDDKGNLPDCREIMVRMKAGCCAPEGGDEKK